MALLRRRQSGRGKRRDIEPIQEAADYSRRLKRSEGEGPGAAGVAAVRVLNSTVIGAGGAFWLGYDATSATPDDDQWLSPAGGGVLFAVWGGVAVLLVGLIVAGSLALVGWLRRGGRHERGGPGGE